MKSTPNKLTDRVTRSRKSTSLHESLIVPNSPHHRNLRTRSVQIEMDAEAKETPEEEPKQDSVESVPQTPTRSTRRSLVSNKSVALPTSVEKQTLRSRSLATALSIQDMIAEDAKMESAIAEDRNSDPSNEESTEIQDQKVKRKRSSVKDIDDESDSMSNTKSNLDASSAREKSVLRTSKRLFGSKYSSSEDQQFTRVTRRTRLKLPEIKSLETEPSKVGAKQEPTKSEKSEEMESVEVAPAQSIETKVNSSEGFVEKTNKSPIFKKSSVVLEAIPKTEDNSSVGTTLNRKKSPQNKKKSLDTTEAVPEIEAETTKEETVLDVLEAISETEDNSSVGTRLNRKKSPKNKKKSLDTTEEVPEIEAETNKKETVLDETTKLEIQNSSSISNLLKEMDQKSTEKSESVNPDLYKFRDIGEKDIKDFISVCRHETEKESSPQKGIAKESDLPVAVVLLERTDEEMVNDEKDDLILLLDESNDSIDIPKKKSKSLQKDKEFIDFKIIPNTFEEVSVFDTPQSSPEEAVSSKTSQKTDKVSETPKTLLKEAGESQKTPKSAKKEVRGNSDAEEVKHKKTQKTPNKKAEESSKIEDTVSELETPKTVLMESQKTPKSAKEVKGNSDGEDAKHKKNKKTPKKAEKSSEVEEIKTPIDIGESSEIQDKKLAKTPKSGKDTGESSEFDTKQTKTPKSGKKGTKESSGFETEQTKTPKSGKDIGESLNNEINQSKTPKSVTESSDVEEVKHKISKSAKKKIESSEVEEIKTPKKDIGESSEVQDKKLAKTPKSGKDTGESSAFDTKQTKTPKSGKKGNKESSGVETEHTKTPKSVKDTGESSAFDTKQTKTPKSGKKDIAESSDVQEMKPVKTPKSVKKNAEKVHAVQDIKRSETLKSGKDEGEGSFGVEETKLTKKPESEKKENVESSELMKSKKHKKKSKSKKGCDESSEVEELKLIKTPKSAKEAEEKPEIEEIKQTKTPKSAKKAGGESSEAEQTKAPKSVKKGDGESSEAEQPKRTKTPKSRKKSGVESSETEETVQTKPLKPLKRKVAESFKLETKHEEAPKSAKSDSGESSGVEDSKSKKARKSTKDSLESSEVEIKPPKTPKSGKKVCESSEPEETKYSDQCTAEVSNDAVVVVNMHQTGWESSSFKEEMKTPKKAKDSSVISKVKSPKSVFTEASLKEMVNAIVSPMLEDIRMDGNRNLLNIQNVTESAISFLPISKIQLKEETTNKGIPDLPLKKTKKAAVKEDLQELLHLQDDETDHLELKKLMKKLKKKSLKKCEVSDNEPENQELMKLMKKLKKKSLKNSEVEESKENPKNKNKTVIPEVVDMSVGKKRKAKKSSVADEKKMKLETVEVKTPGVIITSSIPSSVDRIDIQELFLEKDIKLLSMRKANSKTELCIEDVDQIGDAMSLLSSKYFGQSVRIDAYHTCHKTDSVTDDNGFRFCQVYVNQIPPHATESDLTSLFPKAIRCDLPKKSNGRNSGFCFLTFPDKNTAREHIMLNKKVNFAGYKLGIYSTREESSQSIYGNLLKEMLVDITDLDELLILENLPTDLNELNLSNLFPSVVTINVKLASQLKKHPACAIVVCKNAEQAQMFLAKDIMWKGQKLIVKKTTEKLLNFVTNQNKLNADELADYDGRLLKVTDLPAKTKLREIEELFPSSVLIKLFAQNRYAVVAFSTIEETVQISANQTARLTVRGKDVEIKRFSLFAPSTKLTETKNPKKLLHVRGFTKTTTVKDLEAVFKGCRVVLTNTGNMRYAIVKCGTAEKAKRYMDKKNLVVGGKILKIRRLFSVLKQMKQEAELAD